MAMACQVQHYPMQVRSSRVHGKGIFSKSEIPAGAILYESDDYTVLPSAAYGSIQKSQDEHIMEDLLRWENHSCLPNTELQFSGHTILLMATRPIHAGEEIVCDYRDTEGAIPAPFQCNCGHCDGIMIQ